MYLLLDMVMFHCHVSLLEGTKWGAPYSKHWPSAPSNNPGLWVLRIAWSSTKAFRAKTKKRCRGQGNLLGVCMEDFGSRVSYIWPPGWTWWILGFTSSVNTCQQLGAFSSKSEINSDPWMLPEKWGFLILFDCCTCKEGGNLGCWPFFKGLDAFLLMILSLSAMKFVTISRKVFGSTCFHHLDEAHLGWSRIFFKGRYFKSYQSTKSHYSPNQSWRAALWNSVICWSRFPPTRNFWTKKPKHPGAFWRGANWSWGGYQKWPHNRERMRAIPRFPSTYWYV